MGDAPLSPALTAFDTLAPLFDERFAAWQSVAAQRRAVRRRLLRAFPEASSVLELGGGTGEDALFLAARGRRVHLTDGAPSMVARAAAKAEAAGLSGGVSTERVALEELGALADRREASGFPRFDGAFSNFAAVNCLEGASAWTALGSSLRRLVRPGGRVLLVVFGPFSPAEALVLLGRGKRGAALRRLSRQPVAARVNGHDFTVRYFSPRALARAMAPHLTLRSIRGIGLLVPPSSAEPIASRFPRALALAESIDRLLSRPLALLGDHVLLELEP